MKVLMQRLAKHPGYARTMEWSRLVAITGSAQVLIQAIGFVSGILVIRLLPTHEYALYTLTNSMVGIMVMLADGGITAGVMSQGGQVWQDRTKLGAVLATGLELRKIMAVASVLFVVPVLVYLLHHHGATWLMVGLIVGSLILPYLATLSGDLFEIIPKLQQDITSLQKIQVVGNLGRLAMLGLTMFVFPWAFVAVLATGLPQLWSNRQLKRISAVHADRTQLPNPVVRRHITDMIKRLLPGVIYYCLSGQITVLLISFFGSTAAVAQVGALGRLAMLLTLVNVVLGTLISPRFARLPNRAPLLLARYLQIQAGLLLMCTGIVGAVYLFSGQLLWVIGPNYANLKTELVLNIIGSCLGLVAGASFSLYVSRGWSINPLISIPLNIVSVAAGAFLINVSTLQGILKLNIFIYMVQAVVNAFYILVKIIKSRTQFVPVVLAANGKDFIN